MATIKLDHIELLTGPSNYGEGYWGHTEGNANIYSVFPIEPALAVPTANSTPLELTEYRDWWKVNSKARTIIERHITPVILALLPQGVEVAAMSCHSSNFGITWRM